MAQPPTTIAKKAVGGGGFHDSRGFHSHCLPPGFLIVMALHGGLIGTLATILLSVHCSKIAGKRLFHHVEEFGMDSARRTLLQNESPESPDVAATEPTGEEEVESKQNQEGFLAVSFTVVPSQEGKGTDQQNQDGDLHGDKNEKAESGEPAPPPKQWPWATVIDIIPSDEAPSIAPSAESHGFDGWEGPMQLILNSGEEGDEESIPTSETPTMTENDFPTSSQHLTNTSSEGGVEPRGVLAPVSWETFRKRSSGGEGIGPNDATMDGETSPGSAQGDLAKDSREGGNHSSELDDVANTPMPFRRESNDFLEPPIDGDDKIG